MQLVQINYAIQCGDSCGDVADSLASLAGDSGNSDIDLTSLVSVVNVAAVDVAVAAPTISVGDLSVANVVAADVNIPAPLAIVEIALPGAPVAPALPRTEEVCMSDQAGDVCTCEI
jgi:hypothetical protein